MSSDDTSLSRRKKSNSLNKFVLAVIMVALMLLYTSINDFYATHTSLHREDYAIHILKQSSVGVISDSIIAPTTQAIDVDKIEAQISNQVSSQIEPLQNEVKDLQTSIKVLAQLLQESTVVSSEKVRGMVFFHAVTVLYIEIAGLNLMYLPLNFCPLI